MQNAYFLIFLTKIFGQFKKMLYLCTLFRALCAGRLEKPDVLDILEVLENLEKQIIINKLN